MTRRLVLGCGSIGTTVIEKLAELPGDLIVIDDDPGRVEALREENVAAELATPADEGVLAGLEGPFETVVVAGDEPSRNQAAAAASRSIYPDACLVIYTGRHIAPAVQEALADLGDRLVDPGSSVAAQLFEVIGGDAGQRVRQLTRVLRGIDGLLGIFMHDNPDPDAIASAIALRELADAVGVTAEAYYFGSISHQENRAFVNLLDLDLRNLKPEELDLEELAGIALVDHSRPGVNDQLPPETPIDIVIDHHPPRAPVDAEFVDLRRDAGATSTLLADYLRRMGLAIDSTVSTALLYGIRVDTRDFGREITGADFQAASYLLTHADVSLLDRIESPSVTAETMDTLARAIRNRERRGSVVVSGVGAIGDRDSLAQAADHLLDIENVTTTIVFGFMDQTVFMSARTRGTDLDIGEAMRQAFGQIGSAGGHVDMAGAQLPLGILGEIDQEEEASLETIVNEVLANRFFEVVGLSGQRDPRHTGVPIDESIEE